MENEQRKQIIEIWKSIVEVQRHFNDISMRIRSMFVIILLALFASIGFLLNKNLNLEISIYNVQFATFVPLFGIFGAWLFYIMDRYWYHRLLVGSVNHAIKIEKKYKNEIPELSLSEAIGEASPLEPRGSMRLLANIIVSHDKYRETGKLHSEGKIEIFYKTIMLVLFITMIIIASFGGITIDKAPAPTPALATPTTTADPAPENPPAPNTSAIRKTE